MKIYFTSDLHLFHKNIIKYCNRPFKTLEEMHNTIKSNWNALVQPEDTVYVLGDICFVNDYNKYYAKVSIGELNGNKHLIRGNHDKKVPNSILEEFIWVKDYYKLSLEKQDIILMHYAMRVWDKAHYGSWHLYGHSHGSLSDDPNALSMDVGVDVNNFTPVSYEQVKQFMSKKKFVAIDHHKSPD